LEFKGPTEKIEIKVSAIHSWSAEIEGETHRLTMKQTWRLAAILLAIAAAVLSTGCSKLESRDEMNRGIQAYKMTHYLDAANHFKEAIKLDPTNQNAQLYLATSYMTQWIPGAESAENTRMYQAAQTEFQKVLDKDPKSSTALQSMAFLTYSSAASGTDEQKAKALDEAKKWNERRIEVDPKEAEAYYSLGVIAWTQAYGPIQTERVKLGMKSEDPGPVKDKKVRAMLQEKYGQTLEDGIKSLQTALSIDAEYDDAMSYLNLLYRKKADLEETPDAAKADIAKAEEYSNKALDIKKLKATRPQKKAS
jgi:tetratricopeptide (TPR) repeat protein